MKVLEEIKVSVYENVYLSVCTSDPVYDEVSSFNDSAGYVAERIKNCTIFQL